MYYSRLIILFVFLDKDMSFDNKKDSK